MPHFHRGMTFDSEWQVGHRPGERVSVTRRDVLRRTAEASTLAIGGIGSARADTTDATDSSRATIMTRNLDLGADLGELFGVESLRGIRRAVDSLHQAVKRSHVKQRMAAIAGEIAATKPDLVGVQEAALIRVQRPGDVFFGPATNAETVEYDYLELLLSALSERGQEYAVAVVSKNADVELPSSNGDVRLTDRDVILARRETTTTANPRTETYDAALRYPPKLHLVDIARGYATVDATVRGSKFTFVTTHLESADEKVRRAQARELRDHLDGVDGPLVLAGDFNDGPSPDGGAYQILNTSLADAVDRVRSLRRFPTCCQETDLRNRQSDLKIDIDHVQVRGGFGVSSASRVGRSQRSKVRVDGRDGVDRLWPSDHAGVVVTLDPPAATASATASADGAGRSESAGGATTTGALSPGFEAETGVLAVLLAVFLRWRRQESE